MLSQIKKRLIIAASTRRPAAAAVGLAMGAWGLVRRRRGSSDHLRSTMSLASGSTHVLGRPMNITGSLRMRADSQKGSRDTENDDGMWATNCYKWLELPDRFPDTIGRRKDSLPGDSLWSDVSHQRGYAR